MRATLENGLRLLHLFARGGRKLVLNPSATFLIVRMALWISVLSLLVKLRPLPRALQLVAAKSRASSEEPREETAKRLARAIDLLLRVDLLIFKPICWKRAAVLHRYLALNGITSRIVFGVRKGPKGEIDGHAWLESDGKPILEATVPNYKITYAFPSHDPFQVDLASMSADTLRR
ncbi:MAG: lasso peptide biosynthesis B2 protein [Pyrinomonadaceae bacterium]